MRDYQCTYSTENGPLHKWACWSQIRYDAKKTIYIENFTDPKTKAYINTLVKIINKIQPCALTDKNGVSCISYKLIGLYNNDLILLNFIRNLWNEHYPGYSKAFFERLEEVKNIRKLTPFEKLCEANVYAVKTCGKTGYGDHSNCHENVKVKKLPEDFHTKQICETRDFLCKEF